MTEQHRVSATVISWLRHTADDLKMALDETDDESIVAVLHEVDRRLAAYEPATELASPITFPALPEDIAEEVPKPDLPALEKIEEGAEEK